MHIFTQTKDQFKKETYPNLKNYGNRVVIIKPKKKNTLVSRNADDEENLHPCGRKLIFLINLTEFFKQSLRLNKV